VNINVLELRAFDMAVARNTGEATVGHK